MEENSISAIQRRDFPRYATERPLPITIITSKNTITAKGETINISQRGLCIKLDKDIPVSERVELEIYLHDNKNVLNKGRVIWSDPKLALYGIDLSEYKEEISEYWTGYISGVASNEVDRREKKERRERKEKKNKDVRRSERRENYPIFLKVKRYNRIKNMMNTNRYFYLRELESGSKNRIMINGKEYINFGSNNYLGMTTHPEVIEAGIKAMEKYGIGSGSVRVLGGTMDLHNELEQKLAKFKSGEDCVVFATGYSSNVGVVSCIADMTDELIVDEKSHASLIDGSILSKAKIVPFRHNNMKDLERILNKNKALSKLIITDGVFSMDGDIAPLDKIYKLGEEYNTPVLVDDAHATGVIGKNGRGTASHFGLEGKIALNVGTLSKALGNIGGFVVSDKNIIHYLKHSSRAFLFSTSLPPAICATTIKAIDILERDDSLLKSLWDNINFVKKELLSLGFDLGLTETAIIPIVIKDDLKTQDFIKLLDSDKIFVNPVIYPAVRKKESRARISIMATHTRLDLEILIESLIKAAKKIGVI